MTILPFRRTLMMMRCTTPPQTGTGMRPSRDDRTTTRRHNLPAPGALATAALIVGLLLAATTAALAQSSTIASYLNEVTETTYTPHVLALEAFGTRYAKASTLDSVTGWIAARFRSFGFTDVAFDSFSTSNTVQRNVIATMAGSDPAAGELIVCAHHDSYSTNLAAAPGADDNASGCAAVLEMARVLQTAGYTPRLTLRFITFGAEELGLIGSTHHAAAAHAAGRKIVQVQNYDMIGYCPEGAPVTIRVVWYDGARDLAERDSSVIRRFTPLNAVLSTQYRTQTDSYPFAFRGYKAVFNIEQTFTPFYHSPRDSSTTLNPWYAVQVTRSGLALLLETDGVLTQAGPPIARVPERLHLEQNYPNPFNGQTVIRYSVPHDGMARVSVLDLLGREVAVLADEQHTAGTHEARFSADGHASGIYFCRLMAGGTQVSTRMLLIR